MEDEEEHIETEDDTDETDDIYYKLLPSIMDDMDGTDDLIKSMFIGGI